MSSANRQSAHLIESGYHLLWTFVTSKVFTRSLKLRDRCFCDLQSIQLQVTVMDYLPLEDCKCIRISGHLEAVKWLLWPREYRSSPGYLRLGDWTTDYYIWLHYVESNNGLLADDDVLLSKDTRYWSIRDVQRYFYGDLHCEKVLFTYQYPSLRMPSHLGSYLWKDNTALKLPSAVYMKELHRSLEITLKKMEAKEVQINRLIISDQLIKIDRLDVFKRKTFFRILLNILSFQDHLQLVSFENLCCKRLEGVRLIQQLACFNAKSIKYLFLWRFVLPNENPILVNYSYIKGSGQYLPRPDTKQCFLRSLGELRNLRLLALEYSHIADGTGGALMSLLPILRRPHFRLQLICREDQIPGRNDTSHGGGGYDIPDKIWRRVAIACPDLYVFMAFHRIRDYDNIRRFLTPSIPLRETHLQLGIDLKKRQRQDSDLSCFFRHLAYQYASTLGTLSVHQWRSAVFPLRLVFELMPHLIRFSYIGAVEDEVDLKRILQIISLGVCDKLQQVKIIVQDETTKNNYWTRVVEDLRRQFADIMELYRINFCICIYKS
ncbi:hypothetical protein K1T71_000264 [Dendrolimus kikuchii]|uniref:Uncharacterized protein n=1 Tax=Dendrolimus kikuchii TaxID=765133 RepID=A0ACC1DKD4_9NEOP|nr:hypothetical protein K1T71_000264 [Dendrolimus kikuchii]